MTKKTITETLEGDYIYDLDGFTKSEAILYLQKLPDGAVLSMNWTGYDEVQGDIQVTREETDDEYADRVAAEKEHSEWVACKVEKERKAAQQNIDITLATLQKQMDDLRKVRPE